jgi:hypothetical protein
MDPRFLLANDNNALVVANANPRFSCDPIYGLNAILALAPFFNSIYDGAVMVQGANDTAGYIKQYHNITLSTEMRIAMMSTIGSMAFLQSLLLNAEPTVTEIKETAVLAYTRAPSPHWPQLNSGAFYIVLTKTLLLGAGAAVCDFFGGNYFVGDMQDEYANSILTDIIPPPMWFYLALITGMVAAITTLFTEGVGIFKVVGKLWNETGGRYSTPFSKYFCRIVGWPIIGLAAMEVVCEANATIKNLTAGRLDVNYAFIIATPKLISDLCFSGQLTLEGMDNLIGVLINPDKRNKIKKIEVAAFLISVLTAVIVESIQPALTWQLLTDENDRPPFYEYMPPSIINLLAFGTTVRDGIVQVQSYYPLILFLLTIGSVMGGKAYQAINALLEKMGCLADKSLSMLEELESDDDEDYYFSALEKATLNSPKPVALKQTSYRDNEDQKEILVAPRANGLFDHSKKIGLASSRSLPDPSQIAQFLRNGRRN